MWDVALARGLKSFLFDYGFFVVLFAVALFMFRGSRAHYFKTVVCAIVVLLSLYCSSFVASGLTLFFENAANKLSAQAEQSNCLETFSTVVVLGGGIESEHMPSAPTFQRVFHTVRFLKSRPRGERKLVIFSGGPTTISTPEADVMHEMFEALGGAEQGVLESERESLNTYGNAVLVKEALTLANRRPRVILVTHALHMPRAFSTFASQGFQVCALAVPRSANVASSLFSFSNASQTVAALNELLGFFGYAARGWISPAIVREIF